MTEDVKNYQSTFIITIFGKIHKPRFYQFLLRQNLLCHKQFGFRPGRSAAVSNFVVNIVEGFEDGKIRVLL